MRGKFSGSFPGYTILIFKFNIGKYFSIMKSF